MKEDLTELLMVLVGPFEPGTVALVGAGPGDAALVTMRGLVRLAQADVILHDKLVPPQLLALAAPEAERIFVGKWRGRQPWTQDQINTAMIEHARAGRCVVRLKGGDPFVFGRGGEECEALAAAGIRYEVVPGITAAFGAPAYAGIPLTHRGLSRSFALVAAHDDPDTTESLDFAALARMETLAMYMGVKYLEANARHLIEAGLDPAMPAAVIECGTQTCQRTVVGTIADIAERAAGLHVEPPALVLIGRVVALRERIEWFEQKPLHGQVVAVTRRREQAASISALLTSAGAEVIEAPTIEIALMPADPAVDAAIRNVASYQWLVLTSTNGVEALFSRLDAHGLDSRGLAGVRIAAVGSATADRLAERGIRADLIPAEAVGEALAREMASHGIGGQRVLLLRGDLADDKLPNVLREHGAVCEEFQVYQTVCPKSLPPEFLAAFDAVKLNWITLTSPSSFINLLTLLGPDRIEKLKELRLASIGPVTTRTIRERGFQEAIEANPHDVKGLVAAMTEFVSQSKSRGL